jgi:hypothetical protein
VCSVVDPNTNKEWFDKLHAVFVTALTKHTQFHLMKSFKSLTEYVHLVRAAVTKARPMPDAVFTIQTSDAELIRKLVPESTLTQLVSDLKVKWQSSLDSLHEEILHSFQTAADAVIGIKEAVLEVSSHYSIFVDVLHRCYASSTFRYDIVDGKVFTRYAKTILERAQSCLK